MNIIKYSMGFILYAIAMDVVDDVLLPLFLAWLGFPQLGVVAFFFDIDWITYPLYFIITGLKKWN